MTSSQCILMFLFLCSTVCSTYSCHRPDTFFKSAAVLLLPKDLFRLSVKQPTRKFSSPYCIHASLTSWPRCIWPHDLCPCVCVTGARGWCGACAWAVAWRPDPSAGDGGHGTAAAPVRLSVRPAASGGPWVLHSLRFLPSPENSTAGKPTFVLMLFIRIRLLLNEIPKCF